MPTSVSESHTTIVLILLSKTDELDKLGYTFTSSTQGFRFESIMTSNPYSSKQLLRVVGFLSTLTMMLGSTEISVLRTISLIC